MVPTPPRDTAELGDAWQPGLLPSSRVGPTPVYPPPQEEEAAAERRALFAASASGALGGEAAVGGGCIRARRRARGRDFFFRGLSEAWIELKKIWGTKDEGVGEAR
jgi:hypothetical protein